METEFIQSVMVSIRDAYLLIARFSALVTLSWIA